MGGTSQISCAEGRGYQEVHPEQILSFKLKTRRTEVQERLSHEPILRALGEMIIT